MIDRIIQIEKEIEKARVDSFLVTKIVNVQYLSGFSGSTASLLITKHNKYFITDGRYRTQAESEVKNFRFVEAEDYWKTICNIIKKEKAKKLGFEKKNLTINQYELLKGHLKGVILKGTKELIENLRIIKTDEEISLIKKAVEIAEKAFEKTLPKIKTGISEKDIAAEIEYNIKKEGADDIAFPTIVASGSRGSLPHGIASEKLLKKGELVVIDFGAIYRGYCSDLTKTIGLGIIKKLQKKAYRVVYNTQQESLFLIQSGVKIADLDRKARSVLRKYRFDRYFVHSLGHGLGREVHEIPAISCRTKGLLKTGMVFTVEPGVYFPHNFGIRIENIAITKDNGVEILGKNQKNLIIL